MLGVLLRHEAPEELLAYQGMQASLEALLPYTGEWACPGRGRAAVGPHRAPDVPVSSPRAAFSAAQPDAPGSHLPGLLVAQHEAAPPPCGPRAGSLSSLKQAETVLFYPDSVCGLCLAPAPAPSSRPAWPGPGRLCFSAQTPGGRASDTGWACLSPKSFTREMGEYGFLALPAGSPTLKYSSPGRGWRQSSLGSGAFRRPSVQLHTPSRGSLCSSASALRVTVQQRLRMALSGGRAGTVGGRVVA